MKRTLAVTCLVWMFIWAGLGVWGACPANNPNNPFAITMQGGDPTGNLGYPIAVVGATGCPLDVNVLSGGGGGCVTQCTSPWVVSGTVAATQSGAWTVGVNNFPATQPVSGTVTANQGTSPWVVSGTVTSTQPSHISVVASYTRPADTTAYTPNDVVSNSTTAPVVLTFTNCAAANGGGGHIRNIILADSANQATAPQFTLWLFDTSPAAENDNSAMAISDTENNNVAAILPLAGAPQIGNTGAGAAGNALLQSSNPSTTPFVCAGGTRNLFGILQAKNAYTPVSGETFQIKLIIDQD